MTARHSLRNNTGAANYAALVVRVDRLAEDVAQLNSRLSKTATSEDVRELSREVKSLAIPKQPQFATWIAAATFLTMVITGFYFIAVSPVKENITRIEQEKRDEKKEFTRLTEKLFDSVVPRGEHEQKWKSYDERLSALSVRLNEINKLLADIYSPKDALQDLRQRLDTLQSIVIQRMDRSPKP